MSDNIFKAKLYSGSDLNIDALNSNTNNTPGNVGVCLSGGGSRALTSGMGQLRALEFLKTSDGNSLLSQTKALSTVSGGSWLGITFEMQSKYDIDTYLDSYVSDPGTLTVSDINTLAEGNIGKCVTSNFSVLDIALQALFYHVFSKTPADMLWQTVIAKHILAPYGIYKAGKHQSPTQAFTYDENSRGEILNLNDQNPALSNTPFLTLTTNETPRYFICNTSMFVEGAEPKCDAYQYLAPVQCTPFFTGIVGSPSGVDANGKTPGGGGVTSFAFNSQLDAVAGTDVSIKESRPWSILDCVGASSAAFAEKLVNLFTQWHEQPAQFLKAMASHGHDNLNQMRTELDHQDHNNAFDWIENILKIDSEHSVLAELYKKIAEHELEKGSLESILTKLIDSIVPKYDYWPVSDATAEPNLKPTEFADGGNLENTGVASLLSYSDIDNVIAFVNSPTPLMPMSGSLPSVDVDSQTKVITTEIVVDSQMPPLFGYQPCENGQYVPYDGSGGNMSKSSAWGFHNQVFPCDAFPDFLKGLWTSATGSEGAAIYKQTMPVMENAWFGVSARSSITCVWVYLNEVSDWQKLLSGDVQNVLQGIKNFPNYETLNTQLNAAEVNLLSSMTAWSVANDGNKDLFIDLYQD